MINKDDFNWMEELVALFGVFDTEEVEKVRSWEAVNEQPRVFCAEGDTPAVALYNMADILLENEIDSWTASSVHFDEDGSFYITIYA